ncbi:NUDIX hydrolase domain-containing protein [Gottschalkia acidurici 9a]|uniref:NUDIX hydrolase domain-containing protein n=1 Tax=Gottschalkia acidurici (strain ATCC 7906 / DSM 604 / BCRC 14475 / CIP 104303 / KCTC 5404 / NCIMB 10678 / 9a) TaxID=1128398 RepID=K0AWU7_GOTA9|nr:NUDIX domain-containing protein [Gottschalkia acidurici]AFS78293.1 NUDIX hydrolase domain-containing protein [Gottschalkia acidurici 9a]
MERKIRNSAKALIIKDGKMLASKINDNGEVFYVMPGGGQDSEELLSDAVKRECAEEMGIMVEPKSLEFVVEGMYGEPFHRVDLVFLCDYIGEIKNAKILGDKNQVGFEWISIENLMNEPLYPSKLRSQIIRFFNSEKTDVYLGNEVME